MATKLTEEEKRIREKEKQLEEEMKEKLQVEERKLKDKMELELEKQKIKLKAKYEKPTVLRPVVPKREKKEKQSLSKRSVVVHKSDKPVQNLQDLLSETEETIAELSRIYAEVPDSKHRGVGGRMKPTLKQEQITRQIERAQARADRLMKLIEKTGAR